MKIVTLREWAEGRKEKVIESILDNVIAHPEFKRKKKEAMMDLLLTGYARVEFKSKKGLHKIYK